MQIFFVTLTLVQASPKKMSLWKQSTYHLKAQNKQQLGTNNHLYRGNEISNDDFNKGYNF